MLDDNLGRGASRFEITFFEYCAMEDVRQGCHGLRETEEVLKAGWRIGASSRLASRGSNIAGSSLYLTSINARACWATSTSSAATAATRSPAYRTRSQARTGASLTVRPAAPPGHQHR
jgi:hypothetical protein